MNKSDLIKLMSEKSNVSQEKSKETLESILDLIKGGLERDGKVMLSGFGSWEIKQRKEKKGRNPKTGEVIIIPPRKNIKFKIGKMLEGIL
jgi:DNA-binding protein HU-beta